MRPDSGVPAAADPSTDGSASAPLPTSAPAAGSSARSVMGAGDVARALRRIAHEILERNKGADDLVVLGIPSRGVALAHRLVGVMESVEGRPVPVGALDVTMHRDDLRRQPTRSPMRTQIPADGIDDKIVVLVDDVLYSGRTVGRRSTRSRTSAAPARCASPSSSTVATETCRSEPTTSARTSRRRAASGCGSASASTTASTTRSPSAEGAPMTATLHAPATGRHTRRHLLSANDLSTAQIREILDTAAEMHGAAARGQAADPARADRGQPVLRGLHPHPQLVRDRGQVALGGRHQHLRQGFLDLQGRVPARHRAHRGRDGRRRARHPARRERCGPAGQPVGRRPHHQCRGRDARAPDPGPPRRPA